MIEISELAKQVGLPASTLRFYEEKGLIASVGRRGLRRLYDAEIFDRLSLISLGRSVGFSLEEIHQMFGSSDTPEIDRDLLLAKAEELGRRIKELQRMQKGLLHAAKCPETHHLACPKFRRLMGIASRKAARRRRS